jgi:hypothetical protein
MRERATELERLAGRFRARDGAGEREPRGEDEERGQGEGERRAAKAPAPPGRAVRRIPPAPDSGRA